jgi:RND family efflux transporter MFP subunit
MNLSHLKIERLLPFFALLLLLTPLGCSHSDTSEAGQGDVEEVPRNVRILHLDTGDLYEYLTIYGPAVPLRGTDLSAEEGGRVEAIPRDKGSRVKKGEVLVVLDRHLLSVDLKAAEASAELTAFDARRTRQLFQEKAVSEIEWLGAKTQESQARSAADAARIRHERAATKAPYDGIVSDRYVEPGQLVAPGQPVARIIDPYTLKLTSAVTEQEISWIHTGLKTEVSFDGLDEPVDGLVHWVGFEADPVTGKFPVEIRILNPDLQLRPGVIARARILKAHHRDVIRIPRDAVVQTTDGPRAYVAEGDRARQRLLELGPDQGLMVMVKSGLSTGDRLLVRGQRDVHEGTLVAIQEETSRADGSLPEDPAEVGGDHTTGGR